MLGTNGPLARENSKGDRGRRGACRTGPLSQVAETSDRMSLGNVISAGGSSSVRIASQCCIRPEADMDYAGSPALRTAFV